MGSEGAAICIHLSPLTLHMIHTYTNVFALGYGGIREKRAPRALPREDAIARESLFSRIIIQLDSAACS